jgi:predicted dehydrogenase
MVSLAVIGIGGFGATHVDAARRVADAGLARFTAVADTRLQAYPETVAELRPRGVACYASHEELFSQHRNLHLVTLPLPIPLHAPMTVECLKRGVHVLVEKPPAGTLAEVEQMAETARQVGRLCGVSFQLSTSAFFRAACDAIRAGKLGTVTDVSALCLAQRPDDYYARTWWAGKIRANGRVVRDGPLNNPFAHMSQHLLSFGGAAQGRVARPLSVEAELYAGHDIESEDTDSIRAVLDTGPTLHFYASLCSRDSWLTAICVKGTQGTITWDNERLSDGELALAGGTRAPMVQGGDSGGTTEAMFRSFIHAIEGRATRLACPVEDTLGHAQLVEMVFAGEHITHLHGTDFVRREESRTREGSPQSARTYVEGMEQVAREAFATGRLYSEVGAPWARPPHRAQWPLRAEGPAQ